MVKSLFSNLGNNHYHYLKYLNGKRRHQLIDYKKYMGIQKIMKKQLLTTYFQPIVDLNSCKIIGYEALNRPPVSSLFPSTENFYDYIGQTNQVFMFELYCRNTSLQRFFDCLQEHHPQDSLIFINIHPQVLVDANYKSGETLQMLEQFNISPSQVVFELTEKKAVEDFVQFEKILSNYRSQGFRLAIDDIGSGYNSLKTLVHLKPEFIKLDRSLIHNIDQNKAQQKMVTLLLDFANQSDTYVIAEGIERMEELAFLRKKRIHFGQGYALGKPQRDLLRENFIQSPYPSLIKESRVGFL